MTRLVIVAAALAALASPARADVWQRALDPAAVERASDAYQREMREGDEHVLMANSQSSSREEIKHQVRLAVESYKRAAAAAPRLAEPYFRIANTLYSFYLQTCVSPRFSHLGSPLRDCTVPDAINVAMANEVIDAWNAAEARAPLDPRFSVGDDEGLLFSRALIHTRLQTRPHLEAAAKDYEAAFVRADPNQPHEGLLANLAEIYMMLGQLEDSIRTFGSIKLAETSTVYGAAVALDRDGRQSKAHQLILSRGREGYEAFRERVAQGLTFFVPHGEVFYYYALIEEAHGNLDASIGYWMQYLRSGAHPIYQPRAKEHLDALLVKKRTGVPLARPPEDPFSRMR